MVDSARIGSGRNGPRTTVCEELQLQVGITRVPVSLVLALVVCMLVFPADVDGEVVMGFGPCRGLECLGCDCDAGLVYGCKSVVVEKNALQQKSTRPTARSTGTQGWERRVDPQQ